MKAEWFDYESFQLLRDGNQIWYRNPDSETVIKITVEELPLESWPSIRP